MRDHIVLYVNGQRREVRGAPIFQPLSTYLRDNLGLTGTKVVCSEGDCGSCTVLCGRPRNGRIEYRSLCSCIQFVFQADGCHVVTVEGVTYGDHLNPIQNALVQHHGTQCGFCTPGMVMSIHALLESDPVLSEERLRKGLVGNLCRCTGYDPIVRAGLAVDVDKVSRMTELFNSSDMVDELTQMASQPVSLEAEGKAYFRPSTIEDAVRFKAAHPDCLIISGGTDVGVQVSKGGREISTVMSTSGLEEYRVLTIGKEELIAGAGISLSELEIGATQAMPDFCAVLGKFGSPQIKNAATLGGNIANGSPIGDTLPALFVLNAEVELFGVKGSRRVNINNFYTGYKKSCAASDELITRIVIPRLAADEKLRLFKVSKRKDLDISTFSAAVWLKLEDRTIVDARIAYGGIAATVIRLSKTEAHLKGNPLTLNIFLRAGEIARTEVAPISDVRGSSRYRDMLASNILHKLYYELNAETQATTA